MLSIALYLLVDRFLPFPCVFLIDAHIQTLEIEPPSHKMKSKSIIETKKIECAFLSFVAVHAVSM